MTPRARKSSVLTARRRRVESPDVRYVLFDRVYRVYVDLRRTPSGKYTGTHVFRYRPVFMDFPPRRRDEIVFQIYEHAAVGTVLRAGRCAVISEGPGAVNASDVTGRLYGDVNDVDVFSSKRVDIRRRWRW